MASETTSLSADSTLRWRRLQGRIFETTLVAATLMGVAALVTLFALITVDAIGPFSAEPTWYLVYFGTLVAPTGGYTLYIRRRPEAARMSARAFAVVIGSLAVALITFMVVEAVAPPDAVVVFLFVFVPPLLVRGATLLTGETRLTGPAYPLSILSGFVIAMVYSGPFTAIAAVFPDWLLYLVIVTAPAAGLIGWFVWQKYNRRAGISSVIIVLVGTFGCGLVALAQGLDPSLLVVLVSGVIAPTLVVYGDAVRRFSAGHIGLLGPLVIVIGVIAGSWLEGTLGLAGLDAWLTPTLLLESWSSRVPEEAGVYPQIVGSVMIVGVMAMLSFPIGVGAAIYLEEYAPSTGWQGRLASALDVNISNLAGVPSVVYGLLGLALFRQGFGLQPGIVIAAGATLGLLILPIVIVSAQEALRSVPDELRLGSYGLGASRWQTIRNVVLPEAVPGILTGTILALGRAIGETAPLVMIGVATTRFSPPKGLFSGATALPLQIFAAKGNNIPEYRTGVVAAAALVLLLLMLLMNGTAILIRNRYQHDQ